VRGGGVTENTLDKDSQPFEEDHVCPAVSTAFHETKCPSVPYLDDWDRWKGARRLGATSNNQLFPQLSNHLLHPTPASRTLEAAHTVSGPVRGLLEGIPSPFEDMMSWAQGGTVSVERTSSMSSIPRTHTCSSHCSILEGSPTPSICWLQFQLPKCMLSTSIPSISRRQSFIAW
jgi:hypothetical protein